MQTEKGFTLIEFIMVFTLTSIITVISVKLLAESFSAYTTGTNVTSAERQAQLGIERMTRDIRAVRSASDITTATAAQFSFTDMSGTAVSYTLSGSSLQRNGVSLADGIAALTFSYYDLNGTVTATTSAIRYIGISLNITQGSTDYTAATVIYPDNLT